LTAAVPGRRGRPGRALRTPLGEAASFGRGGDVLAYRIASAVVVDPCQRVFDERIRPRVFQPLNAVIGLHKAVVEYSPVASGTFDFTKLTQELLQETGNEQETARQLVVHSE